MLHSKKGFYFCLMNIFKSHRSYFILYFAFLVFAGYMLVVYSKSSIHLYFNQFYNSFSDVFFTYLTYIGSAIATIIIGLVYFLYSSKRKGLLIWMSVILASLLTQFFKHVIFGPTPRPSIYFTEINPYQLHYVQGVKLLPYFSMPSGHATAAFALTFSIALLYKNRKLDSAMFLLALLVGFSRIYLSQHFLEDVYLGSIIGVFATIIIYSWLYSPKYLEKTKLDTPMIKKK